MSLDAGPSAVVSRAANLLNPVAARVTSRISTPEWRPLPDRAGTERNPSVSTQPPSVDIRRSSVVTDASESDDELIIDPSNPPTMDDLVIRARRARRLRRRVERLPVVRPVATDGTGRVATIHGRGDQYTPAFPFAHGAPRTSHHPQITSTHALEKGPDHKQEREFNIRAECVSCAEQVVDTVFIPCGHAVYCRSCADTVCPSKCNDYAIPALPFCCPVCRLGVERKV